MPNQKFLKQKHQINRKISNLPPKSQPTENNLQKIQPNSKTTKNTFSSPPFGHSHKNSQLPTTFPNINHPVFTIEVKINQFKEIS
jgi:hypothetical protein